MKLNEMREWLARENIQLTKSLGQNFLHDAHQLERIVNAAELTRDDRVLEIGPGLGPLTEQLLARAGSVLAIEKDARLVEVLRRRFAKALEASTCDAAGDATLQLLHDDALRYLQHEAVDWSAWKLVANLPYSVASPILVELSQGSRSPSRIVATLQLEVVRRLVAEADEDDYGILTLLVQADFEPGGYFKIPPGCFFPEPNVDSACVTLHRRAQPLMPDDLRQTFRKVVKLAFSQRRKMMLKLLKQNWPLEQLSQAFEKLGISKQERAEKLTLTQFVALAAELR